jgi:hypothetical protein
MQEPAGRCRVTAVRLAACAIIAAFLISAALAAMLWAALNPPGPWTMAWLASEFIVVGAAFWGLSALQPKGGEDRE